MPHLHKRSGENLVTLLTPERALAPATIAEIIHLFGFEFLPTARVLRILKRFAAGGEWPNGITVRRTTFKTRSPKPALVLPEHLNANVALAVPVARKVIALKASCHC